MNHECVKVGLTLTRHEEAYIMGSPRESGKPFSGKAEGSQTRKPRDERIINRKEEEMIIDRKQTKLSAH